MARAYDVGWGDRDAAERVAQWMQAYPGMKPDGVNHPGVEPLLQPDVKLMADRIELLVQETVTKLRAKAAREKRVILPAAAERVLH